MFTAQLKRLNCCLVLPKWLVWATVLQSKAKAFIVKKKKTINNLEEEQGKEQETTYSAAQLALANYVANTC